MAGRASAALKALRKLAWGREERTTLGKRPTKLSHPEGVAEILSRSRKVRTQIPNKTKIVVGCMVADCKVWPGARTGAKGQRPCNAGPGPDWPALPELGRAQSKL